MKTHRTWSASLVATLMWGLTCWVHSTYVDEDVTMDQFHQALDNYGQWVDAGQYGQAWQPSQVEDGWAPYTDGQWAFTDDGWTWMGAEPWADTVSHYGRWAYVDGLGWCWVPGYDWAPAWVSWRDNGDYLGWAPLPPEADWDPEVGLGIWVDSTYGIGPRYYHFLRKRDFAEHNVRGALLPARHNLAFMLATSNVTHLYLNKTDGRVYTGDPNVVTVTQTTTTTVPTYHIVSDSTVKQSTVVGNDLHVAAPAAKSLAATPAPVATTAAKASSRSRTGHTATSAGTLHGWSGAANPALIGTYERLVAAQVQGQTPQTAPVRPRSGESIAAMVRHSVMANGGISASIPLHPRPAAQMTESAPESGPSSWSVRPMTPNAARVFVSPAPSMAPSPTIHTQPIVPSMTPSTPSQRPAPAPVPQVHRVESGSRLAPRVLTH